MSDSILNILQGAGYFIYPLGLCSFLALFFIIERLLALRTQSIIPQALAEPILEGKVPVVADSDDSTAAKLIRFYEENNPDPDAFKAYAKLQVAGMERGLFILDIVVAAAPLLGLLGTVMGLVQVFSFITPETGMPEPSTFVKGIALALTTTMLGLMIAIPALVGNSYIGRRIEMLAAKLEVLMERLIDISKK